MTIPFYFIYFLIYCYLLTFTAEFHPILDTAKSSLPWDCHLALKVQFHLHFYFTTISLWTKSCFSSIAFFARWAAFVFRSITLHTAGGTHCYIPLIYCTVYCLTAWHLISHYGAQLSQSPLDMPLLLWFNRGKDSAVKHTNIKHFILFSSI